MYPCTVVMGWCKWLASHACGMQVVLMTDCMKSTLYRSGLVLWCVHALNLPWTYSYVGPTQSLSHLLYSCLTVCLDACLASSWWPRCVRAWVRVRWLHWLWHGGLLHDWLWCNVTYHPKWKLVSSGLPPFTSCTITAMHTFIGHAWSEFRVKMHTHLLFATPPLYYWPITSLAC